MKFPFNIRDADISRIIGAFHGADISLDANFIEKSTCIMQVLFSGQCEPFRYMPKAYSQKGGSDSETLQMRLQMSSWAERAFLRKRRDSAAGDWFFMQ